jgi:hypothetical protein
VRTCSNEREDLVLRQELAVLAGRLRRGFSLLRYGSIVANSSITGMAPSLGVRPLQATLTEL